MANIEIRELSSKYAVEAEALTKHLHITLNPVVANMHLSEDELSAWPQINLVIDSGYSMGAFDGEKLIGLRFAYVRKKDSVTTLYDHGDKSISSRSAYILRKYDELSNSVEREADVYRRYNVDVALHLFGQAVVEEYQHQGLAYKMTKMVVEKARRDGLRCFFIRTTGVYSGRVVEKLGFEKIAEKRYDEFFGDDGKPLFTPPAPHYHMTVWGKLYGDSD